MGYYDDQTGSRGRGLASLLFTSLISAVIGGLIVLLLTPALSRAGLLPASPGGEAANNRFAEKKSITVDVTTDITKAVERVQPAVVGVVNLQRDNPFQPEALQRGTGSGIIFDKENGKARIVTNHHVIAGADHVQVVISNGDNAKHVTAKVLGSDDISRSGCPGNPRQPRKGGGRLRQFRCHQRRENPPSRSATPWGWNFPSRSRWA